MGGYVFFRCSCFGVVLALINVKERLCKRFLVLLLVIYYAAMIYSFSTLLVFRFFPQVLPAIYPYSSYNLMLLGTFTILTFPVLYWFMGVRMREILEVVDAARIIRACIYVAVELVLYVIFLNLSGGNWLSMNFYMLVCYCISNIIMMYMFFSEIQMAWKSAVMEEKLRIFELKYQSIDNSIQETQRFRHDLRHHLGIISTLNSQGSKEELSAYLNKYIRVYEGLEEEILCDYPLVNTILKYYIERAVRENIRVTNNIILHKDLGFDFMDMTVLMGNSLENAIEANLYLPVDQRWLYIEMTKVKGTMLILIENSCGRHKAVMGGNFVQQLPEKETRGGGRGLGTESIRRIAEKYGGSVEFKQEEHQYAVRIVLNIP